jgi:hypothetical protein
MRKFVTYILILLPCISFGQLFPKVPDFKGNIEKITEKRYGKEFNSSKRDSGFFRPNAFSGWKYIYLFDADSRLIKRTNNKNGEDDTDYLYQSEQIGNRKIEHEIIQNNSKGKSGDYIEYENFINADGNVENVNFWSYNAREKTKELFLIEKGIEYDKNKLVEFIRYNIKENRAADDGERINLFYDSSGRLIRIERTDMATNLKTILYYYYNKKGFVSRFSIDYLVGLRHNQNNQKQDIFYKYDSQGNWIRRYYGISEKKKRLEAKRKIEYR